jgi:hypothetical protein
MVPVDNVKTLFTGTVNILSPLLISTTDLKKVGAAIPKGIGCPDF